MKWRVFISFMAVLPFFASSIGAEEPTSITIGQQIAARNPDNNISGWVPSEEEINLVNSYHTYLTHPKYEILVRSKTVNNIEFISLIETAEWNLSGTCVKWLKRNYTSAKAVEEANAILDRYKDQVPIWMKFKWTPGARNLSIPEDVDKYIHVRNQDGVVFPKIRVDESLLYDTISMNEHYSNIVILYERFVDVDGKKLDFFDNNNEIEIYLDPIAVDFPRISFKYKMPIIYTSNLFRGRPVPMIFLINAGFNRARIGPPIITE